MDEEDSFSAMDPWSRPANADNSLFSLDPLSCQVTDASDNSLFDLDPLSKPNEENNDGNNTLCDLRMQEFHEEFKDNQQLGSMIDDNKAEIPDEFVNSIEDVNRNVYNVWGDVKGLNSPGNVSPSESNPDENILSLSEKIESKPTSQFAFSISSMSSESSLGQVQDLDVSSTDVSTSNVFPSSPLKDTNSENLPSQSDDCRYKIHSNAGEEIAADIPLDSLMNSAVFSSHPRAELSEYFSCMELGDDKKDSSQRMKFAENDKIGTSLSSKLEADIIKMLKQELEDRDKKLHKAGEIGHALLQARSDQDKKMTALMKENAAIMEALNQEIHSLKQKLDQKSHMEAAVTEEVEYLRAELQKQKQKYNEFAENKEAEHTKFISDLRNQNSQLQTELEQSQLSCKQMEDKCVQLEGMWKDARNQLDQKISLMNETSSDELSQLHADLNSLQNDKVELRCLLSDAERREEMYKQSVERAKHLLHIKEQELEEKQCLATSYYNALERSREENQELKVEIDVIRMETQNMKKKGNSLFSEVEDRRVEAEKELISLKVKYDALDKQFKITRQYEHDLKRQISILLQKASCTADLNHMEHLQRELYFAHNEVTKLHQQISALENTTQKKDIKTELYDSWHASLDKNKAGGFAMFEAKFKKNEAEIEELKKQLKANRMQLLSENQRVLQMESQIYNQSKEIEKHRNKVINLSVKIDEYKMKYEPERRMSIAAPSKGLVEEIPKPTKSNDKENKPTLRETNANPKAAAEPDSLSSLKFIEANSLPKPSFMCAQSLLKQSPKKKVSIPDDILTKEQEKQDCKPEQSDVVDSTGDDLANVRKVRPKGRKTYCNVQKATEPPECKQQ